MTTLLLMGKMIIRGGKNAVICGVIIDACILILLCVLVALNSKGKFVPFRRGFFCDDDTIRYPFKPSTVTDVMLYVGGALIPMAMILLVELIQGPRLKDKSENQVSSRSKRLENVYVHVVPFAFGTLVTEVTTNYMKNIVGRLRPNFMDTCQPDFNCSLAKDPHMYIENYICTNPDLSINTIDIRRSFPSGHSSIASYAVLYLILYIHRRLKCSFSDLLKPLLQLLFVFLATYTALSRIEDNKHHWSDVLGGHILGIVVALAIIKLFPIHHLLPAESTSEEERLKVGEGDR